MRGASASTHVADAPEPARTQNPAFLTVLALVAALLASGLLVTRAWHIDYPYSIDFQTYWLAGKRVAEGQAPLLYQAGGGPLEGTPRALEAGEFKNIPLVATAFAPLAALPYDDAKRAFWWLNLAALAGTAFIVGRWLLPPAWGPATARVLLALAALAFMAPTHIALRHGQTTPLITLLLAAALALGLHRRQAAAGVLLALSVLIKWPAWALVMVDIVRGRRRAVMAAGLTLAGILALSVLLFGPALHGQYAAVMADNVGTVMTGHNNQSVAAVVTRLSGPVAVRDWTPRALTAGARLLTGLFSLALVAGVTLALRRTRAAGDAARSRCLEFSSLSVVGLVVLPVAWDHYFMLLLPGLAALAGVLQREGRLQRPSTALLLATSYAAMSLPTPTALLDQAPAHGFAGGLVLSHYFFGAMGMLLLAVIALWEHHPHTAAVDPAARRRPA